MSVLSPNTQLDAEAVRIELLRQAPPLAQAGGVADLLARLSLP